VRIAIRKAAFKELRGFSVQPALPQQSGWCLDRVSTGSGSDLVKRWESAIVRKSRMLIRDQVATAPCTDPIQVAIPSFEAKPHLR
jgi:hypothetical protein